MAGIYRAVEALSLAVDLQALNTEVRERVEMKSDSPTHAQIQDIKQRMAGFLAALEALNVALFETDTPVHETSLCTTDVALLLQRWRYYVCSLFSWGLLPEATAKDVSRTLERLGAAGLVDPLAGSGWHARLFHDAGLKVVALDSFPVRLVPWHPVELVSDSRACDAVRAPPAASWVLYLSWPPHSPETVGVELLRAWPGSFLLYLGEHGDEFSEGVTGGRVLLDEIERAWEPAASWSLPTWPGFSDDLTLYRRRAQAKACDPGSG